MGELYGSDVTADELREDYGTGISRDGLIEDFQQDAREAYDEKEQELGTIPETGEALIRELERFIILQVVDLRWREHLENMDYLREGVHLRAMAQKDPLVEYRSEGHVMVEELGYAIHEEVVGTLFHAQLEPDDVELLHPAQANGGLMYEHQSMAGADAIAAAGAGTAVATATPLTLGGGGSVSTAAAPQRRTSEHEKLGRNDPCWCGSGKKYKKCHGA
jgi:preprotein translocase subunit SecA